MLILQTLVELVSGFVYTIKSEQTGITTVTDISLAGEGYQIGDVLSVDDANVGGGGGSGFQYTVTNVGFASSSNSSTPGAAFETADTLIPWMLVELEHNTRNWLRFNYCDNCLILKIY